MSPPQEIDLNCVQLRQDRTVFTWRQCCQAWYAHEEDLHDTVAADAEGLGWMTPFSLLLLCPRVASVFSFHKSPPVKRTRKTKGGDMCVMISVFSKLPYVSNLAEVSKWMANRWESGREGGRRRVFVSTPVYPHLFPNSCFWFHTRTKHKQLLKARGGAARN